MYFIAHNIKYLREKHKLSINDIAEKTSIPKSTIASYAEGRARNPSEENVNKLAKFFDVDPSDLLHKNIARFPVSQKSKNNFDGLDTKANKNQLVLNGGLQLQLKGGTLSMSNVIAMSLPDLLKLQSEQESPEVIKALQEIITYKKECEFLKRENELLQARLSDKDQIISTKDQVIAAYQSNKPK